MFSLSTYKVVTSPWTLFIDTTYRSIQLDIKSQVYSSTFSSDCSSLIMEQIRCDIKLMS